MILTIALAAAAISPDAALGLWRAETKHGTVQIDRCGPSICGRLTGSDGLRADPDLRDVHNGDPALRGRQLMGLQILGGFTADGDGWTGGTIYNGDDGRSYRATVTPIDANRLRVRGCVVWPLCRSQTWTRIR